MSWKRVLAGSALVVVAAVFAWELAAEYVDLERTRGLVERRLSDAAGLDVKIAGGLELHLVPVPRLLARDVRVANLPGRPSPELLSIASLDLVVDLWKSLRGPVEIDRLKLAGVEVHVETDVDGRVDVEPEVESLVDDSVAGPVDLRLRSLEIEDAKVFVFDGARGLGTTLVVDALALEAESFEAPISAEARGAVDGADFDLRGTLGSLASLLGPKQPFPISFEGRLFEATVEAEGSLTSPLELAGFEVRFSATVSDLLRPLQRHEPDLPRVGPAVVSGELRKADGRYSVRDLSARIHGDSPVQGEVRGGIDDLVRFAGVDLAADLTAADLTFLAPITGSRFPRDWSLEAHVSLTDPDGRLGAEGRFSLSAPDGSFGLDARGTVADLAQLGGIDLRGSVRARDLATLAEVIEIDAALPSAGPVEATGRLRGRSDRLGISGLAVRIGAPGAPWAVVEGSVDDVAAFRGVRLHVSLDAADARTVLAHVGKTLPDVGPLRGAADVHDRDGSLGIEGVELRVGRGDLLSLEVRGSFGDLRKIDEITFDAKLAARSTTDLATVFEVELPAMGPVEFEGRVTGTDASVRSTGTLRLARTAFSGSWEGNFPPGERAHLRAHVESPHIHLDDFPLATDEADSAERDFWGEARLPFDVLRSVDAELRLVAQRVSGRESLDLSEVHASLTLADGVLDVTDAVARSDTGTASFALHIDASRPLPTTALQLELRDVDLALMLAQLTSDPESSGRVDATAHLHSRGQSARQLRANLAGQVAARLRDGNVASRYGNRFVQQVTLLAIPDLRLHPASPVDCLAFAFDLENGIATAQTLRLDGERVSITGSGSVDLAAETYDLRLTPRPRDPSLLSVAAAVDVTGPLAQPKFTPVTRTIASSAASAVLHNALKPASLMLRTLGITERSDAESPCQGEFAPFGSTPVSPSGAR